MRKPTPKQARRPFGQHPRRMIAIDIENVVGGGVATIDEARRTYKEICKAVHFSPGDHVVIGSSHYGAASARLGWRGACRLVMRSGKDGADLAIKDVLETEHLPERFDVLVLVSGDGIFATTVASLKQAGMQVQVAARPEALSRLLRTEASAVTLLNRRDFARAA